MVSKVDIFLSTRRYENPDTPTVVDAELHNRILMAFEKSRSDEVRGFISEVQRFVADLRGVCLKKKAPDQSEEDDYITIVKLAKILRDPETNQLVKKYLTIREVTNLRKATNFDGVLKIGLIENMLLTLVHTRILFVSLLPYMENCKEISRYQLQKFIHDIYVPMIKNQPENSEYYSAYIAGVIFFLLDARKKDFVLVQDLLASEYVFHLESSINYDNDEYGNVEPPTIDVFAMSAFKNALREFRLLDTNRNGVLSLTELAFFRNGFYNYKFISRVFEISQTYDFELDFKGFVDFIMAIRFRFTKASARFHFEALDLNDDGILTWKEIYDTLLHHNEIVPPNPNGKVELLEFDVMAGEMLDMLKANEENKVTLEEFTDSKMHSQFTDFMTNVDGFRKYESREH